LPGCKSAAKPLQSGVANQLFSIELTDSFLQRLDPSRLSWRMRSAFCLRRSAGGAARHGDSQSAGFPRLGWRHLDLPPQSAEALAQLVRLPLGAADALLELLHGDYLILYTLTEPTVYLLSVRHHRQLM
jgi:hypothetical protein